MSKMRTRSIVLVAFTLVAIVYWIGHSARQILVDQRLTLARESASQQMAPLRRLIQTKLEAGRDQMVRFATRRIAMGAGRESSFDSFDVIALAELNGVNWATSWVEKASTAQPAAWPTQFELTVLRSLPYGKVKDGETHWVRVSDAQGAAVYAVMVPVEIQIPQSTTTSATSAAQDVAAQIPAQVASSTAAKKISPPKKAIIVGFASKNLLAGAVEDFVGTSHSSFIVDDRGYVASHVDIRYIGSLLSDDSVVQTVLRGDRTSGSAQFKDFDGQAVAADFEKVDRTNLYTVITTPTAALIASVDDSMRRIWLFVAIAAVLVLVCSVWLTQRDSEPSILAASLDRENDHSFSDKHVDDRVDGRVGHESGDDWAVAKAIRLDGSTAIHSSFQEPTGLSTLTPGLESLLRETTLAALGHLQLLRAALGLRVEADDESLRHVEAIEREVRLVKTVIDRAHVLSAPIEPLDRQIKVSLQNVIQAAVAHQRPHIDADSIRFETSIENVPTILGDAVELVQSIEAILQNSIEAVHNRVPREVALSLKARDGRVVVSIRDTGIGMSRSMLARALEPFAKAFESPHHLGTGLAFVKRMAERHSAHCEIHSTPGEGTDVTLVFPVQSEDWRDFELQRTKPQPERQSEGAKVSGLADSQATPKFASLTPLSESLVQSLKMPRVPNLPSMPNEFESKDSESIDSEQPPPIPVVAEAKSFAGASVFADDKNLKSIDWQVESLPETSFETDLEPAVAARFEVSSVKIRKPKKRNAVNKND